MSHKSGEGQMERKGGKSKSGTLASALLAIALVCAAVDAVSTEDGDDFETEWSDPSDPKAGTALGAPETPNPDGPEYCRINYMPLDFDPKPSTT